MSDIFTAADTWNGGDYELAIELGPHSDDRLQAALEAVWRCRDLEGCYAERNVEPSHQSPISPTLGTWLGGIATLPNGRQVACGTFTVCEENGSDWIGFYLPMGALATAYDVGAYPFENNHPSRIWREPLDEWLVHLATVVYRAAPFPLALIGHEVSGETSAKKVKIEHIPEERWHGYLYREKDRLVWYPATKYEGDYIFKG